MPSDSEQTQLQSSVFAMQTELTFQAAERHVVLLCIDEDKGACASLTVRARPRVCKALLNGDQLRRLT